MEPRFRRLWLARTVTSIGGAMAPVALAFGVLAIGHVGDLGIVLTAQTSALMLCTLLGGTLADRMSRPVLMVGSDLLRFVSQAVLGILFIVDRPTVLVVTLLTAVHGVGSAFNGPARSGLVRDLVEPEHLPEA